jgi:hypothetical protein
MAVLARTLVEVGQGLRRKHTIIPKESDDGIIAKSKQI